MAIAGHARFHAVALHSFKEMVKSSRVSLIVDPPAQILPDLLGRRIPFEQTASDHGSDDKQPDEGCDADTAWQ